MRKISWLFLLTVFLSFYLHSCRSEDFLQDQPDGEEKYKVSILNKEQVHQQESLVKEIKSKFRYKANVTAKTVQNEILDGAIIGTDQVLLIERNGAKTYTFPVSRTYISDKSESLVVKENADHTYSGILIQYDLTKEQRQQFISGQLTDIKSKVKIYDIDKLNIASRLQTDVVGCYKIVWETGWCSAHVHQSGQSGCTVGGAPAPFIQSVENICENGIPDDGGISGGNDGSPTGPGTGGVSLDLGAYFTIPFISIGHQYYETEDDLDPNYIHYTQVANFFSLLGTEINQLRVANPDLFYYTFYYFKDNGINPTTKAFITQRLIGLNNWYNLANNAPDNIPANNQYFLNWAFEYLVMNPDITWQEFYDQYLATPCENLAALVDPAKANIKPLITGGLYTAVNNAAGESGVMLKRESNGTITSEVLPYTTNPNGENPSIKIKTGGRYYSAIHSHPKNAYPMFSWSDIYLLYRLEIATSNYNDRMTSFLLVCEDDNGVKQTYAITFESIGLMMEEVFTNPQNIGCTEAEIIKQMDIKFANAYKAEDEKANPNYERLFLQLNFGTNIGLYKADSNLTSWSKLSINTNSDTAIVNSTNCN